MGEFIGLAAVVLFLGIPIVAILTHHQRKMAELIHSRGADLNPAVIDEVHRLRAEVDRLTGQATPWNPVGASTIRRPHFIEGGRIWTQGAPFGYDIVLPAASAVPVGVGCGAVPAPALTSPPPVLGRTWAYDITGPPGTFGGFFTGLPAVPPIVFEGCDTYIDLNSLFLSEALGSTPDNPATPFRTAVDGFFNPYGSGQANSRRILDFIGAGYSRQRFESRVTTLNLQADGRVWTLPGGDLRLALGAQTRRETFDQYQESELFTATPQVFAAPGGFGMAGLRPDDVDVLACYDPFTIVSLMQIEDLGFCPKGEGGRFVEGTTLHFDGGRLPYNTHGGMLSHAYVLGIAHVVELVRQLRGEAAAQVPDARVAVYGGYTGPQASTLVMVRP